MDNTRRGAAGGKSIIPFDNLLGWYEFENNLIDSATKFPKQTGVLGFGTGITYKDGQIGRAITDTDLGSVNLSQAAKWLELSGVGKQYTIMYLGFTLDSNAGADVDHILGNYQAGGGFAGFAFGASGPGNGNFGKLHYYSSSAAVWTNSGLSLPTVSPDVVAVSHRDSDDIGFYTIGSVHTDFSIAFPPVKPAGVDTMLFNRADGILAQRSNCTCSEIMLFNVMLSKSLIDAIVAERLAS